MVTEQSCNICGSREFVPGPNSRLTSSGAAPRCASCGSLERQRSLRACLVKVPPEMLAWRNALQFAPDVSLDPAWFRSFETSTFEGQNSIDLQEIDRPDGAYDFISLSMVLEFVPDDRRAFGELARIGSERCIIHNSSGSMLETPTSTHHERPNGPFGRYHYYGSDIEERLEVERHGFAAVRVQAEDPVTQVQDVVHLFCRREGDAEISRAAVVA